MKKLIYALRFMTVIPIKWKENENMGEVARSIVFFPVVGLIIGFSNYVVYYVISLLFSPLFTSVSVVVWWIFITGGLHLDGLGDTADGVWGGTTKEKRLEIMKDSRSGVFAVLTLVAFLLLKTAALNELFSFASDFVPALLITTPVFGRWISVFSIYFFPTARKEGLGKFFKDNISVKELIITMVITVIVLFIFLRVSGIIVFIAVTFLAFFTSHFFSRKLGGLTGDIYGALCESSELLSLIAMLVFLLHGVHI